MRFFVIICTALILTTAALAQQVDQGDIDAILRTQKQAAEREARLKAEREKIQSEVKGLNKRLSQQITQLSKSENDLGITQRQITELDENYQSLTVNLRRDEAKLSQFLGYIQRLERRPPSPILISPRSALKASQTALLIQSLTREFDARSQALGQELKEINHVKTALITKRESLKQTRSLIQREEANLKSLLTQRSQAETRLANEEKQARKTAAEFAAKAENLKQLLDALAANAAKISPRVKPGRAAGSGAIPQGPFQQAGRAFTRAKNTLDLPILGMLKRKFGGSEQGITLSGASRSVVKAPYNGRVEFAGPFRDYERVVILNVGEGYFLILTGLGAIIAETGDKVKTGDIIGALPASQDKNTDIYVEIRKNGAPINPAPWFKGL